MNLAPKMYNSISKSIAKYYFHLNIFKLNTVYLSLLVDLVIYSLHYIYFCNV